MRISDWSSDVCSSDLSAPGNPHAQAPAAGRADRRRPCRLPARRGARAVRDVRQRRQTDARRLFRRAVGARPRSEEHTSELQSLMRTTYAVFCLKKKTIRDNTINNLTHIQSKEP